MSKLIFALISSTLPCELIVARRHDVQVGYKNRRSIGYNSRWPVNSSENRNEKHQEEGRLYETFKLFGADGIIDGRLLLTRLVPVYSEAGGSLRPIQDGSER